MPKVFLSYRRSDTTGYAGRLYERLSAAFGDKNVFMDLDDIAPGKQFAGVIDKFIGSSDFLLALIGQQWLTSTDDGGKRRIDDPGDFVHREIATALDQNKEIIPVIVRKAPIPTEADLPEPLKALAGHQAFELSDSSWDHDVKRLIEAIGGGTLSYKIRRSKWPRRFAILLALVVLTFSLVTFLTRGVTEDAETFMALLAQGNVGAAYESTASAFRMQTSRSAFEDYVTRMGLLDNASASWTSRSVSNNKATLSGSITTKQRAVIPVTMELLKEAGEWRVMSLSGPLAGALSSGGTPQVPADEDLRKLARKTLLDFDAAVGAADFSSFYRGISRLWQNETTPADLQGIFQEFVDQRVSIAAIGEVDAVFDQAPSVDDDGLLVLSGYYPTDGMKVQFLLRYLYEHPEWKLAGIRVSTH
jgi:hypothetical protein